MNLKAFLKKEEQNLRLAAVIMLVFPGAFFAVPQRGFSATLPLFVLFALAAALIVKKNWPVPAFSFAAGLFFSLALEGGTGLSFLFALVLTLLSLLAQAAVRLLQKKGVFRILFAVVLILAAMGIHVLWTGTPWENLARQREAEAYLTEKYPAQTFLRQRTYLDRGEKCYVTEVTFPYEENELTDRILWKDKTEDGYFQEIADRFCDTARGQLFPILRERYGDAFSLGDAKLSAGAETFAALQSTPDAPVTEELTPYLVLSIELTSQTKKRDFAENCKELQALLREAGVSYGELVVLGTDGNVDRYTVRLLPDTDPEDILSLCVALQKELPLL